MSQREEMEAVIKSGGGVLHNGRIITRMEHLPTEEQLAASDATARAKRRDSIQRRIAALQQELDDLTLTLRDDGEGPRVGAEADAPGKSKAGSKDKASE